jgi:membrane protein YqaA with SNARE-associated domain
MKSFLASIQSFALGLGGPGLFLIAFLDSSFLSLPQINDLLIIWMVTRQPERMVYYAIMATLGSVAGCTVMYYIGRKGGQAILRKRFKDSQVTRGLELFQRYGVLAVIVPALLPPPAPFKIFVILAGVAGVPLPKFWFAVAAGRGLRYFAEGVLAVQYGREALTFVQTHGRTLSIVVALTVLVGAVLYVFWRRRASREADTASKPVS